MILRPKKWLYTLIAMWMFFSAFYYLDTLVTGEFAAGYDEGVYHKIVKYIMCFAISFFLCVAGRAYILLLLTFFVLLVCGFAILVMGMPLSLSILSLSITALMLPFCLIPQTAKSYLPVINRVIVFSGFLVGIVSIVELTILAPVLESYWAATGGVRSISTLYNPNNLGLYASICLILIFFQPISLMSRIFLSMPVLVSFIGSGSRTAWVAIIAVFFVMVITSKDLRGKIFKITARNLLIGLLVILLAVTSFLALSILVADSGIESSNRGADLYTASIRVENFFGYIKALDIDILLPDLTGLREMYIQDNFYLTVVNSFGIVGVFLFLVFFLVFFRFSPMKDAHARPWVYVFVFYLISGLSGSQLNSFPNNQLFFISLGAVFLYKKSINSKLG